MTKTDIRFGEKITETPNEDGTTTVTTKGYFDGLKSVKVQIREDTQTSRATLLTDVIKSLDALKTNSTEVTITIKKDRYGSPSLIQKTWTVSKEKVK